MPDTERDGTEVVTATSTALSSTSVLRAGDADVGRSRETKRRHRLRVMAFWLGIPAAFLWYRIAIGQPVEWGLPSIDAYLLVPILFFAALLLIIVGTTVGAGRSPHVMYRPEQITTTLDDVKGIDPVKDEVVRSLNLFLAHKAFANDMGGTPRRGILFEGAPGTGKTYLAKAMAREAGVPVPLRVRHLVPVDVLRRDRAQDPLVLQAAAQGGPRRRRRDRLHRGDRRDRHGPRWAVGNGDAAVTGVTRRPRLRRA